MHRPASAAPAHVPPRTVCAAIVFSALLGAATSSAIAFEDAKTGFGIDPPAPFVANPLPLSPGPGLDLGIVSSTGEPPMTGTDGQNCVLRYEEAAANNALTQRDINEATQSMWRIDQIKGTFANFFEIADTSTFTLGEVVGFELLMTPKSGPDAENVRMLMSMAETPAGRFTLACTTTAAAIEAALPQFRAIRDTARLP